MLKSMVSIYILVYIYITHAAWSISFVFDINLGSHLFWRWKNIDLDHILWSIILTKFFTVWKQAPIIYRNMHPQITFDHFFYISILKLDLNVFVHLLPTDKTKIKNVAKNILFAFSYEILNKTKRDS